MLQEPIEESAHTTSADVTPSDSTVRDATPRPRARPLPQRPGVPAWRGQWMREALRILLSGWRISVAVAIVIALLAVAYLFLARPVYESSVMAQVEDLPELSGDGKPDLLSLLDQGSAVDAEMEILRSRSLLQEVVGKLGLDVEAAPDWFPLIGQAVARRRGGAGLAGVPWGLGSFAWGGERIRLERLIVPDDLLDEPLRLTALENGRYRLEAEDRVLVDGAAVGDRVQGGTGADAFQVQVDELVARPGTRFELVRHDPVDVAAKLAERLEIRELGKAKTGILVIALQGSNPAQVAEILNALTTVWMREDIARRVGGTEQTLQFLDTQLALLRDNLGKAEAALNGFQTRSGAVSLDRETESMVNYAVEIEKELSAVELEHAELARRFTEQHPALQAVQGKLRALRARRAALDEKMHGVPSNELELARLTRDVRVASSLYEQLLARAQELRILRPGTRQRIHLVDPAVAARRPESPRPPLVATGAFLLALMGGAGAAFARHAWRDAIDAPDDVERETGLPVYVSVPHSVGQERAHRADRKEHASLLAASAHGDPALEALRSLRTALQYALVEAPSNVVALLSPGPGAGKSFLLANVGVLAAEAGRKVLVIDADLRRGHLHRTFGVPRAPGLTGAVSGAVTLDAAIRHTAVPGLDLLATGALAPNPSELLGTQRFAQLLATCAKRYDLVLLDTAPVLPVADGALAAAHAGVNLLVLRAGHPSVREVKLVVDRLAQVGAQVNGAVVNDVRAVLGDYGRYGRRYQYDTK